MKRIISGLLAVLLVATGIHLPVFAAGEKALGSGKGDISVILQLNYPEKAGNLSKRNFEIQLDDSQGKKLLSTKLDKVSEWEFQEGGYLAEAVALGQDGQPLSASVSANDTAVHYYRVDFLSLPNNTDYQVSLKGNGYKNFTSEKINIANFSRQLLVGTKDGSFTIGDINNDNKVDSKDLEQVEKALETQETQSDLNGDGVIDISDIALVNHHIDASGQAELLETTAIASLIAELDGSLNLSVSGGSPNDIFDPDKDPVKFQSNGNGLVLPINLNQNIELAQIQVVSPLGTGAVLEGTAEVVYEENGAEKTEIFTLMPDTPEGLLALKRDDNNSNIVVISLGKLVPVKKITITVTKVEGTSDFMVIDEIKFLKDIVPENPVIDGSVPKNLKAAPGNESVNLTWKAVNNVTGYRVKYGTKSGSYSFILDTENNKMTVSGLKNLTDYYFVVHSLKGDIESAASSEVKATPQPTSAPPAPDFLKVEPLNQGLRVSWKKTENATSYNVFYKKSDASEFIKFNDQPLESTSASIGGLENGTEYSVYVTALNQIGESRPSLTATGIPEKIEVVPPKLPTLNRISNDNIALVEMGNRNNVASQEYPNGFNVNNVIDGDYNTHWTARAWWESKKFIFTFKDNQEYTMDYVVYVPRLESPDYLRSLSQFTITTWDKNGNQTDVTTQNLDNGPSVLKMDNYVILPFPKTENIHKIAVEVRQWNGSPTGVSLSEIAFYSYSDVDAEIQALFSDGSFTKLASGVTEDRIRQLEERVQDADGYFVNKDVFLEELDLARSLLKNDTSKLGRVVNEIQSRNTKGDIKTINTFQPLGAVAQAGKQFLIYASIPAGETVTLVPTQYFAEANAWTGESIQLRNGRNIVKVTTNSSVSPEKGGALYIQYSGTREKDIVLQLRGEVTKIPMLELSDRSLSESEKRQRISAYIEELTSYVAALPTKNRSQAIRNSTEISYPNVLLSLPADQALAGIKGEDSLYNSMLAWEQLLSVLYRTHGIDHPENEHSRHNIRYARMFSNAFMYASGAHIGIGYGSAAGMVQGNPVEKTGKGNANNLFGWGIAHEIGHVMDTLGKAEITNNIYSLFGQTYDGGSNALKSRLENSNKYEKIFQKTAIGAPGMANDVFASLGMYWQLHLAYDDENDNFYNLVNKKLRENVGAGENIENRLAIAASQVAGKDLSEFFSRWGVQLSSSAVSAMSGGQENRAIWYLSDESRRVRMQGGSGGSGSLSVTAQQQTESREVNLTFSGMGGNMQGYEITRLVGDMEKRIGFTSKTTFTDTIGAINNQAVSYRVRAVDILGNVVSTATSNQVNFSHNNLIDRSDWDSAIQSDGSYLVTFKDPNLTIAGIRLRGGSSSNAEASSQNDTQADESADVYYQTVDGSDGEGDFENTPSGDSDVSAAADEGTSSDSSSEDSTSSESPASSEESPSSEESSSSEVPSSSEESSSSSEEASSSEDSSSSEESSSSEDSSSSEESSSSEDSSSSEASSSEEASSSSEEEPAPKANAENPDHIMIQVSSDGNTYETVLNYKPSGKQEEIKFFTKDGQDDGRIGFYDADSDAKNVRVYLPAGFTMENVDFLAYPGDSITINEAAIGRLSSSFSDGETTYPAGTVVITGTYRGDPVYNTIRISGQFQTGSAEQGDLELTERPINGTAILFAQVPEQGDMSEIWDGIWVFVPNLEKEAELTGEDGCGVSLLPAEIMASLYRTNTPNGSVEGPALSTTPWISSPTEDSMPQIQLGGS